MPADNSSSGVQPRNFGSELRRRLDEGATLDIALAELREAGASIIESIVSVRSARQCDLAEAKRLVHFSPVWADVVARNEKLHEELEQLSVEPESGCPICGTKPTSTQYVFYPKFLKVRCRGCRTELKYVYPLWKKVVFCLAGGVVALVGLVVVAVLEQTHGLSFLPWAAGYIAIASVLIGYVEAWHVQKRYRPVPA